ncbi:uncharacterized protein C8Q71DRAFT_56222 [Rhodofomes roseus]|uniref:Uncharacterized protein n=1 Tax=Rhodofomes roseus TaxID=34475 RepID=A0ABQ8KG25_9APHY|nr:uncharacterized protein C8Q71DRAFT_56222 [Rhodofomes roseus]KAH9836728.1 hypothetical protein C8Q71DRAFT_56222 [Rhodofomes roseus]
MLHVAAGHAVFYPHSSHHPPSFTPLSHRFSVAQRIYSANDGCAPLLLYVLILGVLRLGFHSAALHEAIRTFQRATQSDTALTANPLRTHEKHSTPFVFVLRSKQQLPALSGAHLLHPLRQLSKWFQAAREPRVHLEAYEFSLLCCDPNKGLPYRAPADCIALWLSALRHRTTKDGAATRCWVTDIKEGSFRALVLVSLHPATPLLDVIRRIAIAYATGYYLC